MKLLVNIETAEAKLCDNMKKFHEDLCIKNNVIFMLKDEVSYCKLKNSLLEDSIESKTKDIEDLNQRYAVEEEKT